MNYYHAQVRVNTKDVEKGKTVAEAIHRYFAERGNLKYEPLIYGGGLFPAVGWFGRERLMGRKELQFIKSLCRDFKVEIVTNECSSLDELHTVSWTFEDGQFWKVLDAELYINNIDVARLAGYSLGGISMAYPLLAKSVGTLSRDEDCLEDVFNLISVLRVIKEMNIQPSNDDVADWLAVRDFLYEFHVDTVGDEHDGNEVFKIISYMDTACLKAGRGIKSTSRSLAATI